MYSLDVINIVVDKHTNVIGIAISDESTLVKLNVANTMVNAEKNSFIFFIQSHPFVNLKFYKLIISRKSDCGKVGA